jgi:hypothetical protein
MCSIRSGVGSTHRRLDLFSMTRLFVKVQINLGGQTVKLEFVEGRAGDPVQGADH